MVLFIKQLGIQFHLINGACNEVVNANGPANHPRAPFPIIAVLGFLCSMDRKLEKWGYAYWLFEQLEKTLQVCCKENQAIRGIIIHRIPLLQYYLSVVLLVHQTTSIIASYTGWGL